MGIVLHKFKTKYFTHHAGDFNGIANCCIDINNRLQYSASTLRVHWVLNSPPQEGSSIKPVFILFVSPTGYNKMCSFFAGNYAFIKAHESEFTSTSLQFVWEQNFGPLKATEPIIPPSVEETPSVPSI